MAVAVALVVWFVAFPAPLPVGSIAIVQFTAQGTSDRDQALALSMTENLKAALNSSGRVDIRDVRSRQSKDAMSAGRSIAATTLLTGNVQLTAESAHAVVTLTRVADGKVLWTANYDGDANNWFPMEDRAASDLLQQVLREVAIVQHHTADPAADQIYWRASVMLNTPADGALHQAGLLFETAARKDPAYPLAWAGVAEAALRSGDAERARAAARRAVELDPTIPGPHLTLALIAQNQDWDWPEAEHEFRRAVELGVREAAAHHLYGVFSVLTGHTEQGLAEILLAEHLEPLSAAILSDYVKCLYLARRYDDAITGGRAAVALDPAFAPSHRWLSAAYLQKGMEQESKAERKLDTASAPESGVILAAARKGDRQEVQRLLPVLESRLQAGKISAFELASLQSAAGNKDKAFELLDEAFTKHQNGLLSLKTDPGFDGLRSDARFNTLLKKLHLI